jgi:hypothetical protein
MVIFIFWALNMGPAWKKKMKRSGAAPKKIINQSPAKGR